MAPWKAFSRVQEVVDKVTLSLLLFLLVAKSPNSLTSKVASLNLLCGFHIDHTSLVFHHLQFVDNIIILSEVHGDFITNLYALLRWFEHAFGLPIHYQKSELFGVIVDIQE